MSSDLSDIDAELRELKSNLRTAEQKYASTMRTLQDQDSDQYIRAELQPDLRLLDEYTQDQRTCETAISELEKQRDALKSGVASVRSTGRPSLFSRLSGSFRGGSRGSRLDFSSFPPSRVTRGGMSSMPPNGTIIPVSSMGTFTPLDTRTAETLTRGGMKKSVSFA